MSFAGGVTDDGEPNSSLEIAGQAGARFQPPQWRLHADHAAGVAVRAGRLPVTG